jgi:hypothetical protein
VCVCVCVCVCERTLAREAVVRDFVPGVERPDSPDDGLAAVGHDVEVQLVLRLQGPLVRHDGVSVHHGGVQESHVASALL